MTDPDDLAITKDEADTILRMAEVSGLSPPQIIPYIDSPLFAVAVALATERWDYLDGTTGKWRRNKAKQERQFRSCAMTLLARDIPPH